MGQATRPSEGELRLMADGFAFEALCIVLSDICEVVINDV